MKRIILIIISLILTSIAYLIIVFPGGRNCRNVNKIKNGMSDQVVLNIMGPPDTILKVSSIGETESIFVYQPSLTSDEGIFIQINDSLKIVQGIVKCGD
jgi:hypothetical protein